MTPEATLETFVDRIVEEKGLTGLDPEVVGQMKKDLLDRVESRINAMLLANMPEDKLEEFERVLDAGNDEATRAFCADAIPDLDQRIADELLSFRATYLNP